mmetsp:Transcript_6715/g.13720  ORF Transcript_6715/g.13720 Transcript_6715/m.13720 type:complete len:531 (+) Transcript_6715:112-1704(+)
MGPRLYYSSIILLSCSCTGCFIAPTRPAFHPTLPPIPTTQSSRRHHLHVRNPSNNKPHNLADAAKRIPKNDVFQIAPLSGVGLTSILPQQQKSVTTSFSEQTLQSDDYGSAEATMTTFVGTKRGELMQVSIHPSDPIEASVIPIKYFNEEIDLKPYPIFSMASLPYHHRHSESTVRSDCKQLILTGGADRFISVWEEESPCTKDESATSSRWKIKERLGPHTGWVKDIASIQLQHHNDENDSGRHVFLFSIGCNCIEVWKPRDEKENHDSGDDRAGSYYRHYHKLQVDSSVEMGCTLSSDLLCLAIHRYCCSENDSVDSMIGDASTSNMMEPLSQCELMAGGVDGRIHRWRIRGTSFVDSEATSAHEGRVNGIVICHKLKALVSIGNDGLLVCWKINNNESISDWQFAKLCLNNQGSIENGSDSAITSEARRIKLQSMCIVSDGTNESIVAIGSTCGRVMLVRISKAVNGDGELIPELMKDSTKTLVDAGVIHALQFYKADDAGRGILLFGGSGFFVWTFDLNALKKIAR